MKLDKTTPMDLIKTTCKQSVNHCLQLCVCVGGRWVGGCRVCVCVCMHVCTCVLCACMPVCVCMCGCGGGHSYKGGELKGPGYVERTVPLCFLTQIIPR